MSQEAEPAASAHARVLQSYFETTSAAGLHEGPVDYRTASAGIKRGLGDWLDVAGRTVLDLGCGTGELCWLASTLGASQVVGINLSEGELAFARPHVDATFVLADILTYLSSCPDASVDRIFALNILEHLTKDDLVKVLDQTRRCLTEHGHLVAMVPNATSAYGTMTRYWDITHHNAFTPSSVRQLMRLCGFAGAEFREWGPTVHGAVSLVRYGLWQVIRGLTWFRLMVETASGKGGISTADMLFRLTKQTGLAAK
jgi:SAM-dependent methyltransferase